MAVSYRPCANHRGNDVVVVEALGVAHGPILEVFVGIMDQAVEHLTAWGRSIQPSRGRRWGDPATASSRAASRPR